MHSFISFLCLLQFIPLISTAPVSDLALDFEPDLELDDPDLETRGTKCPANFRNVVFNTGAPKNPGWPNAIWDSLEENGVSNWSMTALYPYNVLFQANGALPSLVGFTENTVDKSPTYQSANGGPATTSCAIDQAQMKICMDPRNVQDSITLVTGPNPPEYLELFNEPDYSYEGYTPLTSPQDAATALAPLMAAKTTTQFISPAVAFTNTLWLENFNQACNNCINSSIPIISAHVYNYKPDQVMLQIQTLHNSWPDKRIWITELAPASSPSQGCTLDQAGMINWMQTVIPQIVALGYVDRIFWNSGEYVRFPNPFLLPIRGGFSKKME